MEWYAPACFPEFDRIRVTKFFKWNEENASSLTVKYNNNETESRIVIISIGDRVNVHVILLSLII